MLIPLTFSFFPPLVYCLTFFVSKFQGSKSNSLSVALIWSTSCIHGFDWKNWLFINTCISVLLSFLNDLSYRYQIGLKSKMIWDSFFAITFISLSVSLSICLSVFPFISLSFHPSENWFHIPKWWLCTGERILHHNPCPMPKTVFASLLLITYLRLGVALLCLFLIVMHEQSFGAMIPFCDLEINFDKNFIKQTISHMITK